MARHASHEIATGRLQVEPDAQEVNSTMHTPPESPKPHGSRRSRLRGRGGSVGADGRGAAAQDAADAFKSFPLGTEHPAGRAGRLPAGRNHTASNRCHPSSRRRTRNPGRAARSAADGQGQAGGTGPHLAHLLAHSRRRRQAAASGDGRRRIGRLQTSCAGEYFVNVAFGRAAATRKIRIPESGAVERQQLVLDAGAVKLNAVSGADVRIPPAELSFSIYSSEEKEDGERTLIMADVSRMPWCG